MHAKLIVIQSIFEALFDQEIPYMLLRGFNDIPEKVSYTNDIDVLCKSDDISRLSDVFLRQNFELWKESARDNQYLYLAMPHYHFRSTKHDLHFDIVFNLSYRSPNKGEWVSVHEDLQKSIWTNVREVSCIWRRQPANGDLIVHLICHCVFDKQRFDEKHIKEIDRLLVEVDLSSLSYQLSLVFFRFTPSLIQHLLNKQYSLIVASYLSFSDY